MDSRKIAVLESLKQTHGIVQDACRKLGLPRSTFYNWKNEDKEFADAVEEITEESVDFVEGKLFSKISDGDTASIIFYLKTKAKRRGYIERQEITGADGESILLNFKNVGSYPAFETKANGTGHNGNGIATKNGYV